MFARQVEIYTSVNHSMFPADKTKLLFAASYLTGPTAIWEAPYIDRVTKGAEFTYKGWTKSFRAM